MAAFVTSRPASHDRRLEYAMSASAAFATTWRPIDAERVRARRVMLNKQRMAAGVPYHEWQAAVLADDAVPGRDECGHLVHLYLQRHYGRPPRIEDHGFVNG